MLVTGAARGQGEAEARLFAAEGAKIILGDVLDEEGEKVAAELGDDACYLRHDVTSEADWQRAVGTALDRWGRLDGLVNNAGILVSKPILEMDPDDFRRVLEVNLVGCFLGIQHAGRAMRDGGGGSIVNVSSTAGFQAVPTIAGYVSSKFGMRGLTRTAAAELGRHGIRVNSIHPGGVDTEMSRGFGNRKPGEPTPHERLPLGRIGQPVEIARLALFLLSDESSYSTGSEFVADGGMLV